MASKRTPNLQWYTAICSAIVFTTKTHYTVPHSACYCLSSQSVLSMVQDKALHWYICGQLQCMKQIRIKHQRYSWFEHQMQIIPTWIVLPDSILQAFLLDTPTYTNIHLHLLSRYWINMCTTEVPRPQTPLYGCIYCSPQSLHRLHHMQFKLVTGHLTWHYDARVYQDTEQPLRFCSPPTFSSRTHSREAWWLRRCIVLICWCGKF